MPVDFPLAVKACLAAGYGQWNLPASHLFWALLKKKKKTHRAETDHISCIQFAECSYKFKGGLQFLLLNLPKDKKD